MNLHAATVNSESIYWLFSDKSTSSLSVYHAHPTPDALRCDFGLPVGSVITLSLMTIQDHWSPVKVSICIVAGLSLIV